MIKEHLAEKVPAPAVTRRPRTIACQVAGSVPAAARVTLISQHLTGRYTIRNLNLIFPIGADHLVRVYPLVGLDPSAPTTGLPPGFFLLSEFSPRPYLVGTDCEFSIPLDHRVETKGTWLKLHLYNLDIDPHTITAIFSLLELIEEET